jgi:hypothetical protein
MCVAQANGIVGFNDRSDRHLDRSLFCKLLGYHVFMYVFGCGMFGLW